MKHLGLCLMALLALAAGAAEYPPEPPIAKGTAIQIESYDKKTKTYSIVMPEYEAQGPNYATLKDLLAAVPTIDAKRVTAKPEIIVGMEYVTDNVLKLQSSLEVDIKAGRIKPKKRVK